MCSISILELFIDLRHLTWQLENIHLYILCYMYIVVALFSAVASASSSCSSCVFLVSCEENGLWLVLVFLGLVRFAFLRWLVSGCAVMVMVVTAIFFLQFSIKICCRIFFRKNYLQMGNMKEEKACYTRVFCVSYFIFFCFHSSVSLN